MAIALDAASTSTVKAGTGTITWSHTVGSGSDRLLVVGIAIALDDDVAVSCTAVTYAGVSMTLARRDEPTINSDGSTETTIWMLHNPPSGEANVVATVSGDSSMTSAGTAVSYTGCNQSSSPDAVNGKTGTTTSGSQTFAVTTVADNAWCFAVGVLVANDAITIAASHTSRGSANLDLGTTEGYCRTEDTNAPKTPAGAVTIGFTLSNSDNYSWAMSGISFAPASGAPPTVSIPIIYHQLQQQGIA